MLSSRGFKCTQDSAHDGAADAHEGDHHDEPPDGDGLSDQDAAARLGRAVAMMGVTLLVRYEGRVSNRPGINEGNCN